jgi:hypothetical protein
VFTARYALSPYIKQICFVFRGLIIRKGCVSDFGLIGGVCLEGLEATVKCSPGQDLNAVPPEYKAVMLPS